MVENDLRTLIQFISQSSVAFDPDNPIQPSRPMHQLQKANDALARLRRIQGSDTETLNLIIDQASEVLAR